MICLTCKYAPFELFAGFGEECRVPSRMAADTARAEQVAHANLCGFGKAVIQDALWAQADDLVLTNCCDVMRRSFELVSAYDGNAQDGKKRFLWFMDLPRTCGPCQVDQLARQLKRLRDAYAAHSGKAFSLSACQEACAQQVQGSPASREPYIAILGARVGDELHTMIAEELGFTVRNLACTAARCLDVDGEALVTSDEDFFFTSYARALLTQLPCMRMADTASRRVVLEDPVLRGIVYHTMKFCDFYGAERAEVLAQASVPVLSLETDFTLQSVGQLKTRIQAFGESLRQKEGHAKKEGHVASMKSHAASRPGEASAAKAAGGLFAGIDSGSTSTDVAVVDASGAVCATCIIPTGGGAQASAEKCLAQALAQAGIARSAVVGVLATGYGREYLDGADGTATEITCHARGGRMLCPDVRTIIDIGGQDSKVIVLDDAGDIANFVMNDKCAAGTGRFLEMMARTLGVSLDEMARLGLSWKEEVTISSMCSVFAESEVVSLVAQNKDKADIVHGLNEAVAAKTSALLRRAKGCGPYLMTGGVSRNAGVVKAIEARLGEHLVVPESAQLAGALGAALLARECAGRL